MRVNVTNGWCDLTSGDSAWSMSIYNEVIYNEQWTLDFNSSGSFSAVFIFKVCQIIKYSLTFPFDRAPADKRDSGGEAGRLCAMLRSSLGGHDLNVLERTVCCSVVSVTAGNAHAVTYDHRWGGQLCQTLVHAVRGQLIWKTQTHDSMRSNESLASKENATEDPKTAASQNPRECRTNVKVGDLEALLLGQLQHHLDVVCVRSAQQVPPQQRHLLPRAAS